MKLFVVGCGQCGGRIADEFARINIKAHVQRGFDICTGAIAVNTDIADLSGLFLMGIVFLVIMFLFLILMVILTIKLIRD